MFPGVQVQLDNSSYVTPIANGLCQVYINTLSTTAGIILLGDTLFLKYIITFDKSNAQVGFSGDTKSIQVIGQTGGFLTSQYIMMSLSIIFMLIFCFLICILRAGNFISET